jgi:peptidyl-prolyl cis-trans isomerase D
MAKKNSISKTLVWIMLGLLFVGLAGFGATNLSGTIRTIGQVGDKYLDVNQYARNLQQELRAYQAETGAPISFAQAQAAGIDQAVLQRFVQVRALDNEATQMGLSVGDETLSQQIVQIPAFQGVNGEFDREGYRFALENSGMTEAQFEESLRDESARTLLQNAILSGVQMPETFTSTLLNYIGEERSFEWAPLTNADLAEPLPTPTEDELQAYYEANISDFSLPPSKDITYVWLRPIDVEDQIPVDEEALQALYQDRASEYIRPERRLVERLVFSDDAAAETAKSALAIEASTFEQLVSERGLSLGDVDMGDVDRLSLDAAGEAVFAADVGDVVGPLPSSLGPALFRVNGVLPAQSTSFEDARPELMEFWVADKARRLIEAQVQDLDDMLAGGATLEDLANETDMNLYTIGWYENSGEGIASYNEFRDEAAALTEDDFPRILSMDDGAIYAMRMDGSLPERPVPIETAMEKVVAGWENEQTEVRLLAQAEALLPQLKEGVQMSGLGLNAIAEDGLTRNSFVQGTPEGFMPQVFDLEVGEPAIIEGFGSVIVVTVTDISPPAQTPETETLSEALRLQMDQALAQDLFAIYARDVQLRARPQLNQQAIQAVHANFQ